MQKKLIIEINWNSKFTVIRNTSFQPSESANNGKVSTETVIAIFNVAEAYFLSLSNEALNKIDCKESISKLLTTS